MTTDKEGPNQERAVRVVQALVVTVRDEERGALLAWARKLLEIRESSLPAVRKAQLALRTTARIEVAKPLILVLARQGAILGIRTKKLLWDERSWIARAGLAGVLTGTLAFGGKGAGIAAFGGAIGVPLWLVLGAGGAVLGALIEELSRQSAPTTTYRVIEARRVGGDPISAPDPPQEEPSEPKP